MRAFALFAAALLFGGCSIISAFYSKEKKFELAGLGQDGVKRGRAVSYNPHAGNS